MVGWQPWKKVCGIVPYLGSPGAVDPHRDTWNGAKWHWDDCAPASRNQVRGRRVPPTLPRRGVPGWRRLYWRIWRGHNLWKCLKRQIFHREPASSTYQSVGPIKNWIPYRRSKTPCTLKCLIWEYEGEKNLSCKGFFYVLADWKAIKLGLKLEKIRYNLISASGI